MTSKHTNDPDFIGWLANEFDGGVFQDLPEASLEDGEHYENARDWYERVCTIDQGARAEREYALARAGGAA